MPNPAKASNHTNKQAKFQKPTRTVTIHTLEHHLFNMNYYTNKTQQTKNIKTGQRNTRAALDKNK
jgi:hypothetical protein